MSDAQDMPEVSLDHIELNERPLIVCDVDEVVLEFLTPFRGFIQSQGYELLARSFKLHGNVVHAGTSEVLREDIVDDLLEAFFIAQGDWQFPATGVSEALTALSDHADIVFLTAMAPRHETLRRALLDRFGLHYPLVATEGAKGPVVQRLHRLRKQPVVFVDDILRNLRSVREHVPDCLIIHIMANAHFRVFLPPLDAGMTSAADWPEAARMIQAHFRV
ncbi:hypothetical protein [Rhizobium sp. CFBP 8762]|uniref:hypothetical protein n=1 Tax=Rhizobium sp. CFBP 8762 TaxID=2775279 RepID=UPI001FD4F9B0|nr:hypothetical protein [Rhizobium sp. CFBP 8762]